MIYLTPILTPILDRPIGHKDGLSFLHRSQRQKNCLCLKAPSGKSPGDKPESGRQPAVCKKCKGLRTYQKDGVCVVCRMLERLERGF